MRGAKPALVLAMVSSCYVEVRARGDLLVGTSGSSLDGAIVEGEVMLGAEVRLDQSHAAMLGGGGGRVPAATRSNVVDHQSAPNLDFGMLASRPDFAPEAARGTAWRLGVSGWTNGAVNVSSVRLDAALRFGSPHIELEVGPSLSWWDAAKIGAAVGAGGELALRLVADPRELF